MIWPSLLGAFKRFAPRGVFAGSVSATNLILITTISQIEKHNPTSVPFAPLYIALLFFDAFFQSSNEIRRYGELAIRPVPILLALIGGAFVYISLALPHARLDMSLLPIVSLLMIGAASRNIYSFRCTQLIYSQRTTFLVVSHIIIALVMLSSLLAYYLGTISGYAALAIQLAASAGVLLVPVDKIRFVHVTRSDMVILLLTSVDLLKNQSLFIFFASAISPHLLAQLLLARSVLSPASLLLSTRRRAIEDEAVNDRKLTRFFSPLTFTLYLIVGLIAAGALSMFGFKLEYLLLWAVVIAVQDARAYLVRIGLSFSIMPKFAPAVSSGVSAALSLGIFAAIGEFNFFLILIPPLIDAIILALLSRRPPGSKLEVSSE